MRVMLQSYSTSMPPESHKVSSSLTHLPPVYMQWDEKHIDYNFDVNKGKIFTEFFKGGQTNVCYNCLDKHVQEGRGDQLCFIWEGNDVGRDRTMTYKEALEEVCRVV